jgi:hypothetical protein
MEVAGIGSMKTLGNTHQTLSRLSPEDSNLHCIHSSAVKMEAAGSSETFLISTKSHVIISQKVRIFFTAITSLP